MTEPGGPRRRGRHSSADDGTAGVPASHWITGSHPGNAAPTNAFPLPSPADRPTNGFGRVSGVLDRYPDQTGPLVEPEWWSYGSSDHPDHPLQPRAGRDDAPHAGAWDSRPALPGEHPSGPLPPFPTGVWDRLRPRNEGPVDDAETVAQSAVRPVARHADPDDRDEAEHLPAVEPVDPRPWHEQTGGLDVIGAHVDDHLVEPAPRRRGLRRRNRPAAEEIQDRHRDDAHDDDLHDDGHDDLHHDLYDSPFDDHEYDGLGHEHDDHERDDHEHDDHDDVVHVDGEAIPVAPYDPRTGRRRRRRRPVAVLVSLFVLVGLVVGIVVGGHKLLSLVSPASRDFTGQGSGSVEIRVHDGDTLSDIARTLVEANVIASSHPFVTAADAHPDATGIQPGVYRLREQMSGAAALDLMLDPQALVSRVTVPEGLTVKATLARLAKSTNTPVAQWEAAAANPAALGLPAYANGRLEGFLFPAQYDFAPGGKPVDMLKEMVGRATQAMDKLQIPANQRLTVLTKASIVQAEAGSVDDMGKVARVLENRLADGMPLQLDTTVNYANGKAGVTTTSKDRQNPSPYNTYLHAGLPPGAISNPGEEALRAVLAPTPGEWRFFVVVDPDTGETRFAVTATEHAANVKLFQQWLQAHPGG